MVEVLKELDVQLFQWINGTLSSPILDWIMPILRNKYTWLPFYIFIAFFVGLNAKWKGMWLIICLVVTVGVSDTMSSNVVKKTVKRIRPCNTELLDDQIQERVPCGSGYSFTSSHATNHFAVATFLMLALGYVLGKWKWLLLLWAGSIGYAQIYVGVHYPFDIVGGAILGSIIGLAFGKYYLLKAKKWFPDPSNVMAMKNQ